MWDVPFSKGVDYEGCIWAWPGDRAGATEAFATTEKKTAGVGQKMDLAFSVLR